MIRIAVVLSIALCATLPLAAQNVPEGTPWVVILATSNSDFEFAEQARADIDGLMGALKNGTGLGIYAVNSKVDPVYTGRLDDDGRRMIAKKLKTVQYRRYTDIAGAFTQVFGSLSPAGQVMPAVLVLTDAKPVAPRHTAGEGRSLAEILNDVVLLPPGIHIFLRIYGKDPVPKITRQNITIFVKAPIWPTIIVRPVSPPPAPSPTTANPSLWKTFAASTLSIFIVVGIAVILGLWRNHRRGDDSVETARMLKPVQPLTFLAPASTTPSQPKPVESHRFVFRVDDEKVFHLDKGRRKLVLGDDWESELNLEDCNTAALFELSSTSARLKICNVGPGDIQIGEFRLAPGDSRWLPRERVEIALGNHLVIVLPETKIESIAIDPELGKEPSGVSK